MATGQSDPAFRMKVGADVAASVEQFKKDLQDIVAALERNPPKIKVDLSEDSVKKAAGNIQKAFEDMSSAAKGVVTPLQEQINRLTGVSRANEEVKHTADDMKAALAQYDREVKEANEYLAELAKREKDAAEKARQVETPLQKQINSLTGVSRANEEVKHTANDMKAALAQYDRELKENTKSNKEATQSSKGTSEALKEVGQSADQADQSVGKLSVNTQQLGQLLTRFLSVTAVIHAIRELAQVSIELDSSFTQLQIVTRSTDATMREFGDTAAQIATRVGASITDVVDSATTFARLGYTLSESANLAEYTTMLQNVGDIDTQSAQNAITSIVKAFSDEIDISNIESVMDKLVVVGNNFPISVSQLAEGMTNASSVLAAAGNSFDQSVALLTAANTTVQNAARSSTGLRTIAARLRNVKTELDDLGEVITEAKYQELVDSLTDAKVSLVDQNGELRSTYDILKDLAAVWDELSSSEQAALASNIAGKLLPGRTEMCA